MIQPLLKYPDPRIRLISGNIRFFNDTLRDIIEDMTDTMKAEGLDALSAIQIGIQYNVIVLKDAETYRPYVNARIVRHEGNAAASERSPYYEGFTVEVPRYTYISIVYEDPSGEMQTAEFLDEAARTFQHQLDYAFGSTFVDRVPKKVKAQIDAYLDQGLVKDSRDPSVESSCPTVFVRDYFRRAYRYTMLAVLLTFPAPLIVSQETRELLYTIDRIALPVTLALIIGYFFYAEYESKKYKQCTSCQTGNIIGTVGIGVAQLAVIAVGVFAWMAP